MYDTFECHFKPVRLSKIELRHPVDYGGTLSIQTSLLNIGRLLHKMGFVQREIATTVPRNEFN